MKKIILILLLIVSLSACIGSSSGGVFGSGVSIALDPRTLGTQIDDSIMQKNLIARLALFEKKYLISISVKVLDGRIFLGGKVASIKTLSENLKGEFTVVLSKKTNEKNIQKEINESVKTEIKKMLKKYSHKDVVEFISKKEDLPKKIVYNFCLKLKTWKRN